MTQSTEPFSKIIRVVVAGATGFIGQALGASLKNRFERIGLSRRQQVSKDNSAYDSYVACDLYSAEDAEKALQGADIAIYLVHSMMPTARLTQGDFRDMDLLCADNFARAAKAVGVKQLIYLGGLLPKTDGPLSAHLQSRREVELALQSHGVPLTVLRAGLVIGANGSSFEMMLRLVERLPLMVCPRWTETKTQPIALSDVVKLLAFCINNEDSFAKTFDVGGRDVLTYREMMLKTASLVKLRRKIWSLPLFSPKLSRLWISTITGAPKELVAPLVESLKHEMLARDDELFQMAKVEPLTFEESMREAIAAQDKIGARSEPVAYLKHSSVKNGQSCVRSVQRLPLPRARDALWVADEYFHWLPEGAWPFVRVQVDRETARFFFARMKAPLLELKRDVEQSSADCQLFYITGGVLSRSNRGKGRMEFRQSFDSKNVIAAIHDFEPALPWYVYRVTQAYAHLYVMWRFRRHLNQLSEV